MRSTEGAADREGKVHRDCLDRKGTPRAYCTGALTTFIWIKFFDDDV
jgi:hypothetical protein